MQLIVGLGDKILRVKNRKVARWKKENIGIRSRINPKSTALEEVV